MNEPEAGASTCEGCRKQRRACPSYGQPGTEERRREALLCIDCGLVTVATISTRCEGCKEVERLKSNARYARRRAAGTCIRCHRRRASKGSIRCHGCNLARTLAKQADATDRAEWQEPDDERAA